MGNSSSRLEKENEDLKKQLQEQNKRLNELTDRLSHEMGKKIGANESSIENIGVKNRPMNLIDEYNQLSSEIWLNVKTEIDDKTDIHEKDKCQLLCDILKIAEDCSFRGVAALSSQLGQRLNDPQLIKNLCNETTNENKKQDAKKSESKDSSAPAKKKTIYTLDDLSPEQQDILRHLADTKDIEPLTKEITAQLDKKYSAKSTIWQIVKTDEKMKIYIDSSARFTWKMAVQRPQMEFKKNKPVKYLGPDHQDLFWGSSEGDKNAEVVEVYPILCHGESVMHKGKVFIVPPSTTKGKK